MSVPIFRVGNTHLRYRGRLSEAFPFLVIGEGQLCRPVPSNHLHCDRQDLQRVDLQLCATSASTEMETIVDQTEATVADQLDPLALYFTLLKKDAAAANREGFPQAGDDEGVLK